MLRDSIDKNPYSTIEEIEVEEEFRNTGLYEEHLILKALKANSKLLLKLENDIQMVSKIIKSFESISPTVDNKLDTYYLTITKTVCDTVEEIHQVIRRTILEEYGEHRVFIVYKKAIFEDCFYQPFPSLYSAHLELQHTKWHTIYSKLNNFLGKVRYYISRIDTKISFTPNKFSEDIKTYIKSLESNSVKKGTLTINDHTGKVCYTSTNGETFTATFDTEANSFRMLIYLVQQRRQVEAKEIANQLKDARANGEDSDPKRRVLDSKSAIYKKLKIYDKKNHFITSRNGSSSITCKLILEPSS